MALGSVFFDCSRSEGMLKLMTPHFRYLCVNDSICRRVQSCKVILSPVSEVNVQQLKCVSLLIDKEGVDSPFDI